MEIIKSVFDEIHVSAETKEFNRQMIAAQAALPDAWSFPAPMVREARRKGVGPFKAPVYLAQARNISIDGPGGALNLRHIAPNKNAKGAYLHIHGGGWMLGAADMQDEELYELACATDMHVFSVDYRLAPEEHFPAAIDDCEAAALWFTDHASNKLDVHRLCIGGESAGAHLSVLTLIRLRDKHGLTPFCGANLNAGCYDLSMTPSVRHATNERLILDRRDIEKFVAQFVPEGEDLRNPEISPLYDRLYQLPPALFSVGTKDPLIDDSLFMAGRWISHNSKAELTIYPGGCHVVQAFDIEIGRRTRENIIAFLNKCLSADE